MIEIKIILYICFVDSTKVLQFFSIANIFNTEIKECLLQKTLARGINFQEYPNRKQIFTMYIAYSAIQKQNDHDQQNSTVSPNHEQFIRYQAYIETCAKYSKEIAAIQQYIPGWTPTFR